MNLSRIDKIEQYILDHKTVSTDTLCEVFKISKNTARRDLNTLSIKGTITKTHGGAMAKEESNISSNPLSFHERTARHTEAKQQIGALAASFVKEQDVIFIDSGTTTIHMVEHLKHLSEVTIITSNLQLANKTMDYPNLTLIMIPGTLKSDTAAIIGDSCIEFLNTFNITRAFMACTGISMQTGVCNFTPEKYMITKTVMKKSRHHYLLADATKFGHPSLMTYSQISEFNYILTDQPPDNTWIQYCKEQNCEIISAADKRQL